MPALIALDDLQLRRLETAITRIESGPPAKRRKLSCLLSALESERAELLRFNRRARFAQTPRPDPRAAARRRHAEPAGVASA